MRSKRARVVITGLGAITALGLSAKDMWQGLKDGRSGVGPGRRMDTSGYPVKIAAEVKDFDPGRYMGFKEKRRMALFSQFAVAAARGALEDSCLLSKNAPTGTPVSSVDSERIGAILGTCIGGFVEIRNATQTLLARSYKRIPPTFVPKMLHNAPAANVSHQFGLTGYNSTISTSCAAGAQAIGEAAEVIRRGTADVMLAGGTEAPISDVGQAGFWATRAMTTSFGDQPEIASRPFDLDRDGLVIGEGAAFLTLERLDHALNRSAPIYAEILGYGVSADAHHLTAPEPQGEGSVRAMKWALDDADLTPSDIDYINAHATSTPLGDYIETLAIKRVFGEEAYDIPVSASKSMLGHAIGASGAIEATISTLTIHDNVIHPTINYTTPDPDCDLDYVPNEARNSAIDFVMSNSFGMGGQNVALVIGRFDN